MLAQQIPGSLTGESIVRLHISGLIMLYHGVIVTEAPIYFRPTYKFDHGCDIYDTSSKKRIPSWTDRILFKDEGTKCLTYNSVTDLRSSDHRPVYASFVIDIHVSADLLQKHITSERREPMARGTSGLEFTSESQVCAIM